MGGKCIFERNSNGRSRAVDHFVYLGSCIDQEGNMRKEVRTRIAKAALAFKNL